MKHDAWISTLESKVFFNCGLKFRDGGLICFSAKENKD